MVQKTEKRTNTTNTAPSTHTGDVPNPVPTGENAEEGFAPLEDVDLEGVCGAGWSLNLNPIFDAIEAIGDHLAPPTSSHTVMEAPNSFSYYNGYDDGYGVYDTADNLRRAPEGDPVREY